jgi:hypothetical protein
MRRTSRGKDIVTSTDGDVVLADQSIRIFTHNLSKAVWLPWLDSGD